MANWVDIGERAALVDGSATRGYAHFEYDADSGTSTRPCRIRIEAISGSTFYVNFNNITVDGHNYGSIQNVTQNSGVIWSDNITAGQNVTASWTNPWYAGTKYPSVSGYLPSGVSAPTGLSASWTSHTWNSVTGTVSISSYGTPSGETNRYIELGVCASSNTSYGAPYKYAIVRRSTSSSITVDNNSSGSLAIKGATDYKIGGFASNTQAHTSKLNGTVYHTPPAPLQSLVKTSETATTTAVSTVFTITGGTSTNNTSATVATEIRISTDGGSTWSTDWTEVGTGTAWTEKTYTASLPFDASIRVQARQRYYGQYSEVTTINYSSMASTAPATPTITVNSVTYNSANLTGTIADYGTPSGHSSRRVDVGLAETASTSAASMEIREYGQTTCTGVVDNNSTAVRGGITLKGMMTVYPYTWATNGYSSNVTFGNAITLAPAPGTLSYSIDPTDESKQTINYVGVAADNITTYDQTLLTRTVRYALDTDPTNWTYVENASVTALTTATSQLITVPAGHSITVEAWMEYDGVQGTVRTVTLTNTQDPKRIYGSVLDETEEISKWYGAVTTRALSSVALVGTETNILSLSSRIFINAFAQAGMWSRIAAGENITELRLSYDAGAMMAELKFTFSAGIPEIIQNVPVAALDLVWGIEIDDSGTWVETTPLVCTYDSTAKLARKLVKIYGSVNGVAKLIHEDI